MIEKINSFGNISKNISFKQNVLSKYTNANTNYSSTIERYNKANKLISDIKREQIMRETLNKYDYDFINTKTFELDNNMNVTFDTCWKNKETNAVGRLQLENDEDLAAAKVLECLFKYEIAKHPQKVNTEDDNQFMLDINFHVNPNLLEIVSSCDYSRTDELFENIMFFLLNPNFTEQDLQKAKYSLKNLPPQTTDDKVQKYILNKNQKLTDEQIDAVTLEDVQKLYNRFLTQSQGDFVITLPQPQYCNSKDTILNTIRQIPKLKPFQKNLVSNTLKPIEASQTVKGNSESGDKKYAKYFVFSNEPKLKESILKKMLYEQFLLSEETLEEADKYSDSSDDLIYPDCSYIKLGLSSDDSEITDEKLAADTNKLIENLINTPISNDDLSVIKDKLKEDIKSEYAEDQWFRTNLMQNRYSDSNNTLKSYLDTLDKITASDVQQTAQKYLTGTCIEVIDS